MNVGTCSVTKLRGQKVKRPGSGLGKGQVVFTSRGNEILFSKTFKTHQLLNNYIRYRFHFFILIVGLDL